MEPLFPALPENWAELSNEEILEFIAASEARFAEIRADSSAFVTEERTPTDLYAEMESALEALDAARAELSTREETPEAPEDLEPEVELSAIDELAARAEAEEPEPDEEPEPEEEPEPQAALEPEPEPIVAAPPPRPARSRRAAPAVRPDRSQMPVSLTASIGGLGYDIGDVIPSGEEIARMMISKRLTFNLIPEGVRGEKVPIAKLSWRDEIPEERVLGSDPARNASLIAAVIDRQIMREEMKRRRGNPTSLTAASALCAPLTPYYQLQEISVADRPVRASLPSFAADRGGIRAAAPASLATVVASDATGILTAAQDAAGGTTGAKTCQIIDCPSFTETDVEIIFHCLQFQNLNARAFPELVAQWTNLTLAAHARLAESSLLTAIDLASTQVTASDIGLGATGALLGQILAAANGLRSRHRMDPEAVLRLMIPDWALDLMISDVIRSQFERFDTDEAKLTALLRSFDIEPTFYVDGASGKGQVFPAQGAGKLNGFPASVNWLLFPEGSFLYLDGGTLELGLVRDSVLNASNAFQLFGESFENVAFVGVESLSVVSTICDSGAVSAPVEVTACGNYA